MEVNREKFVSQAYMALNIISFHSPTMAIINMIIWGYVLPRGIAGEID